MFCFRIFVLLLIGIVIGEWSSSMENPILFEGDIILDPDEKVHNGQNTYASIKGGRWPNAVIPYEIFDSVLDSVKENIPKAMVEYEKHTCIRFKKRTNEKEFIRFISYSGCASPVGFRSGRINTINLSAGCKNIGIIMHEIGHSIGLYHEQSRPDRNNYIEILFNNIKKGTEFNFKIADSGRIDSLGTNYDYLSIMHYSKNAFGYGRATTIITKDPAFQNKIGQRGGFSDIDIKQINLMYCQGGDRPSQAPRTKSHTTPSHTLPPLTSPPGGCVDKYVEKCKGWADHCALNLNIKKMCCKTCSKQYCLDENASCAYWAKSGRCKSMPGYMKAYCKKSCQFC